MEDSNSGFKNEGKFVAEEEKEHEDSNLSEKGEEFRGEGKDNPQLEDFIQEQPPKTYTIEFWQGMVLTYTHLSSLCGENEDSFVKSFVELSYWLEDMEGFPDIADSPQIFQSYFNIRTLPLIAKEMINPRFKNEFVILRVILVNGNDFR